MLKIDVDGTEQDVLKGMKNILKKNIVSIILIEINSLKKDFNKKEKKIFNILKKNNFNFVDKKTFLSVSILSKIKCTDNLFVHKFLN